MFDCCGGRCLFYSCPLGFANIHIHFPETNDSGLHTMPCAAHCRLFQGLFEFGVDELYFLLYGGQIVFDVLDAALHLAHHRVA